VFYKESVNFEFRPTRTEIVPRQITTESSFRDIQGSTLGTIHERKKVKYSIQHYCTALATDGTLLKEINFGVCFCFFGKQTTNVWLCKCLYLVE
jgi:hypothetical protein